MAKRLYMTNADYLAIAISPALIMTLVGSLVFFLIEVLYVGQYEARLDYAFALFVFAAVLIARISIEMGSERAVLFALPLGVAMYLFLLRFVEHPSAWSNVINLALLAVVWWCAHKLTWDSTVIDDDEDASGEGLMQRIGVDGPERTDAAATKPTKVASAATPDNELFDEADRAAGAKPWFVRLFRSRRGPHSPGLWVLYFSLAALPLFGIGQYWIPAAEVGRRRYAFFLLLVYVASGLALLVSTSFLNLRRYLRQRRVEMPASIAGTWVGVGAALIIVVMLLAMLIPRPRAEIAISRPPWQAGSPGGLTASRTSVHRDGGEEQAGQEGAAGQTTGEQGTNGTLQADGQPSDASSDSSDAKRSSNDPNSQNAGAASDSSGNIASEQTGGEPGSSPENKSDDRQMADEAGAQRNEDDQAANDGTHRQSDSANRNDARDESRAADEPNANSPNMPSPQTPQSIQALSSSLGGLAGLLKILLYVVVAIVIAYLAWKHRHELVQALVDIVRQLRELFSGRRATSDGPEGESSTAAARRPSFTDFRDPFQSGQHGQLPPEELVRYTFAAFEAWANDRGRPRTPDCTPQELVNSAVDPGTPIHTEARRLVRLYSEVAYASRRIQREAAHELRPLWQMMRNTYSPNRPS